MTIEHPSPGRTRVRCDGQLDPPAVQNWGRPVGDANGVFLDGVLEVHLGLVDTDEGITGVGLGSHTELDRVLAAVEGEDPRATTARYDRMLRQAFKTGHAGSILLSGGSGF